ncbi:hypothetical protein R9C00_29230 [Flammeovirgaceae bacterium SG7u.111]|nr:hypothetical protein [Flammeovirgaceae bacterium SG7u.132]WPO35783.1 hypothetical protein R9C00_29230 [Flammeovirgaceae bacterium SG7u.111]
MKKYLSSILFCLLVVGKTFGQFKDVPFTHKDSLSVDINNLMGQSSSATADTVLGAFNGIYEGLSEDQLNLVFEVSKTMYGKGYRANPHMENFYACIAFGIDNRNLPSSQLTRFLEIADTTARLYKGNLFRNFLSLTRDFCETDTIYSSKYNRLIVEGDDFTFEHVFDESLVDPKALVAMNSAVPEAVLEEEIEEELPDEEEIKKEEWFEHLEEEEEEEDGEELSWGDDGGWEVYEEGDEESWEEGDESTDFEEGEGSPGDAIFESFAPPAADLPDVLGPMLSIKNANFHMHSIYDTVKMENVSGDLLLMNYEFVGTDGKLGWDNTGLDSGNVFCDLADYSFNIKSTRISAEDAELHYGSKLKEPVKGSFIYDSHIHNLRPKQAKFPQFQSYQSNIEIEDLADSIRYRGGFSLQGKKFLSNSAEGVEATLDFMGSNGNSKFTAISKKGFVFDDSLIYSPEAAIKVHYDDSTSISHPATIFKYDTKLDILRARRGKDENKTSPFIDERQSVYISAEMLEWDMKKDSIDLFILNARERIPLVVESTDYFDKYRFIALQGLYKFHPLQMVVGYANRIKSNTFTSYEMATDLKQQPNVVKGAMQELGRRGYIEYNDETDEITVKRKAKLYVYANMGKKGVDFDNMIMHSRVNNGPNLSISVNGKGFEVSGVKRFNLSDQMGIVATPEDGKVNLEDGRNTSFAGRMQAGNFVFRGKEFMFNYDSFKVDLDVVDSISIMVKQKNGQFKEMQNNIVNTGGVLYISHPRNKSGKNKLPQYPILDALKGGTIYFDGPEILGGAYDSTILFDIPPFEIDSLNSSNTSIISFNGTFKSGGIFEDFEQVLIVDSTDNSFGFKRDMPDAGEPVYGGKGTFFNKIRLNNKGIRGDGRINYLTADFNSKDFIFYPDSVLTKGEKGEIAFGEHNGVEFPSVQMDGYKMKWLVNSDSMLLTNPKSKPFHVYDPNTNFEGTLALTPEELKGDGRIETENSINSSEQFQLEGTSYVSHYSKFLIKSDDPDVPAMLGDPVKVEYDLKDRMALIKSEEEGSSVFAFPFVQYQSNISQVSWNLDKNVLVMSVNTENESGLGKFTSGNSKHDSLSVFATDAMYDLSGHVLGLAGVPYLVVANIKIIPDSGKVNIREHAEMDELNGATLEFNALQKRHVLTDAKIKVHSSNEFEGTANYAYTYGVKDTFNVVFDRFETEKTEVKGAKGGISYTTTGFSKIIEDDQFAFAPGLYFQGDLEIHDTEEYLDFKGQASLALDRDENDWFDYTSNDANTHGVINIDENLQVSGYPTKLKTGLFFSKIDREPYIAMVQFKREWAADRSLFQARGELSYSDSSNTYRIAPQQLRDEETQKGHDFVYEHKPETATFSGELQFVLPVEDQYTVKAAGTGFAKTEEKDFQINASVLIEFNGDGPVMETMAEDLADNTSSTEGAIENEEKFANKIAQMLPEKSVFEFLDRFADGSATISDYFNTGIFLTNVDFKWSDEMKAFYNEGTVGLGGVFKKEIDTQIDAYIEIPKAESDNAFNVFLMDSEEMWYYFNFDKTGIRAVSSNDIFNLDLSKNSNGLVKLAEIDEMLGYVSSFRMNYLGIEEMLDLVIPTGDIDPYANTGGDFGDDPFGDISEEGDVAPVEEEEAEEEEDDDGF